ncbi:MAG: hypothetical protein IH600_13065 [Bacteroidetes bacterium]|nr:hypothetical protein [Bacteroidota bacterium]
MPETAKGLEYVIGGCVLALGEKVFDKSPLRTTDIVKKQFDVFLQRGLELRCGEDGIIARLLTDLGEQ